jgi:hypothetical protein
MRLGVGSNIKENILEKSMMVRVGVEGNIRENIHKYGGGG